MEQSPAKSHRRPPSPTNSVASIRNKSKRNFHSRFDDPHDGEETNEVLVDECVEYLGRRHENWDSAVREMARIAARKERGMSDTASNASTVSAYSISSRASVRSSRAAASAPQLSNRPARGHLRGLPEAALASLGARPNSSHSQSSVVDQQGIHVGSVRRASRPSTEGGASASGMGSGIGRSNSVKMAPPTVKPPPVKRAPAPALSLGNANTNGAKSNVTQGGGNARGGAIGGKVLTGGARKTGSTLNGKGPAPQATAGQPGGGFAFHAVGASFSGTK
jgi:hypothetical protein